MSQHDRDLSGAEPVGKEDSFREKLQVEPLAPGRAPC